MINIGERTRQLAIDYCLLRYKHELELKHYKKELNKNLNKYIQNIIDVNVSMRNIDVHRCAYEKLINTEYSSKNTEDIRDSLKIAKTIYEMLIETISKNNSNTMNLYKEQYIEASSAIIMYYKTHFDNKFLIKDLKEIQFQKLRVITKLIIEEDTPMYLINYVYKRLKTDLFIIANDHTEIYNSDNLYNNIKNELLKQIETILLNT